MNASNVLIGTSCRHPKRYVCRSRCSAPTPIAAETATPSEAGAKRTSDRGNGMSRNSFLSAQSTETPPKYRTQLRMAQAQRSPFASSRGTTAIARKPHPNSEFPPLPACNRRKSERPPEVSDKGRVPTNHSHDGSNTTLSMSHARLSAIAIMPPKQKTPTNRKNPDGHPANNEPTKIATTTAKIPTPAKGTNAIIKPERIPIPKASRSQLDGKTLLPLAPPIDPNGERFPA